MEETNDHYVVSKDTGSGVEQEADKTSIPSDPYARVKRELSDEELKSPAVQKLLLSEHDRMLQEVNRLKQMEVKYHEIDKECAILKEKQKTANASEVLYTFCVTGGSLLAGVSSLFWNQKGWLFLAIGVLFVTGGVIFKWIRK
jgi:hypothetical protein